MKVIIAGGRSFNNYDILKEYCDRMLSDKDNVEIVSGTADGADILGERYAEEKGYKITRFPANWELYKKSAGYIRNEEMAKYADACIVFWDGVSKGSSHMIDLSKKYKLLLRVKYYKVVYVKKEPFIRKKYFIYK